MAPGQGPATNHRTQDTQVQFVTVCIPPGPRHSLQQPSPRAPRISGVVTSIHVTSAGLGGALSTARGVTYLTWPLTELGGAPNAAMAGVNASLRAYLWQCKTYDEKAKREVGSAAAPARWLPCGPALTVAAVGVAAAERRVASRVASRPFRCPLHCRCGRLGMPGTRDIAAI